MVSAYLFKFHTAFAWSWRVGNRITEAGATATSFVGGHFYAFCNIQINPYGRKKSRAIMWYKYPAALKIF
jgi:hypothetical protein